MLEMHRKIDDAAEALMEYQNRMAEFASGTPSHCSCLLLREIANAASDSSRTNDADEFSYLIGMVDAAQKIVKHNTELANLRSALSAALVATNDELAKLRDALALIHAAVNAD